MNNEVTVEEMKAKLIQHFDEYMLLEVLDITVTELVDLLEDKIIENYDKLLGQLPDDDDDYSNT